MYTNMWAQMPMAFCLVFVFLSTRCAVLAAPPRDFSALLQRSDLIAVASVTRLKSHNVSYLSPEWIMSVGRIETGSYCVGELRIAFPVSAYDLSRGAKRTILIRTSAVDQPCDSLNSVLSDTNRLWFVNDVGSFLYATFESVFHASEVGTAVSDNFSKMTSFRSLGSRVVFILISALLERSTQGKNVGVTMELNRIRTSVGWTDYIDGLAVLYSVSDDSVKRRVIEIAQQDGMCLSERQPIAEGFLFGSGSASAFANVSYREAFVAGSLSLLNVNSRAELERSLLAMPVIETLVWYACFTDIRLADRAQFCLSSFYSMGRDRYRCIPCQ